MEDEDLCGGSDCLPSGLPQQIKAGIDHKTGGYGWSGVYAAHGVHGVQIEAEDWEKQEENCLQIRLGAYT